MIKRLFHTLRPLKWQQYWYRAINPFRKKTYLRPEVPMNALKAAAAILQADLFQLPVFDIYSPGEQSFTLLNIRTFYKDAVDWNDTSNGLLWAYHLNYFNWLEDDRVSVADRRQTIDDYISRTDLRIGLDSYPISLRCVNWIRFMVRHGIRDLLVNTHLYQHLHRLYTFPEHHLQGNHLWENGCALLFGGQYFSTAIFYKKGKKILLQAITEQIFADGGHIEGSPVYHSLLLSRLLQYLEFVTYNDLFQEPDFIELIAGKAELMLGWLKAITFMNGHVPMVNDAAYGIAPDTATLEKLASAVNIESGNIALSDSGYRMWRNEGAELFIDIADIKPEWQPGHAHADTFSFCLTIDGKPHIIDPGTSTYENNTRRAWERSTDAHNTISIDHRNSSDVWKSFRVGQKAAVSIINERERRLDVSHDGFRNLGMVHRRTFDFEGRTIIIEDELTGLNDSTAMFCLHFHKEIILKNIDNSKFLAGNLLLQIDGARNVYTERYIYAEAFNKTCSADRLCISVSTATKLTIEILHAD